MSTTPALMHGCSPPFSRPLPPAMTPPRPPHRVACPRAPRAAPKRPLWWTRRRRVRGRGAAPAAVRAPAANTRKKQQQASNSPQPCPHPVRRRGGGEQQRERGRGRRRRERAPPAAHAQRAVPRRQGAPHVGRLAVRAATGAAGEPHRLRRRCWALLIVPVPVPPCARPPTLDPPPTHLPNTQHAPFARCSLCVRACVTPL